MIDIDSSGVVTGDELMMALESVSVDTAASSTETILAALEKSGEDEMGLSHFVKFMEQLRVQAELQRSGVSLDPGRGAPADGKDREEGHPEDSEADKLEA